MWFLRWFCAGMLAGWTLPVHAAVNSDISALVQQISTDSMDVSVRRLVAFQTRFMGSDSNAAASIWLGQKLSKMGYPVQFDTFQVNVNRTFRVNGVNRNFTLAKLPQWNVLAVKRGVLYPNRVVVIGGHYDSISIDRAQTAQDVAPGADDNASGVAALLEIARVIRQVNLDVTVVIAFWGAEELGLIGSEHYAAAARARGDDIVVMLQIDAIGTQASSLANAFTIDTTSPYLSHGEVLAQAASDYSDVRAFNGVGGRVFVSSRGCQCSDHQSFLNYGYPALGIFQYISNPALHLNMSFDTLDHVDFRLVTGITKASLAALLQFGGYPGRSADFDSDGRVAFADFLLFAQAYQAPIVETRFDLDRDGSVAFGDFLVFASVFGK